MWIISPVAYPVAMLLDWILGHQNGVVYRRAGMLDSCFVKDDIGLTNTRRAFSRIKRTCSTSRRRPGWYTQQR